MRQEKLIAIAFVVAALIFSTVTYSFAQKVVVLKKGTPVKVEAVKYGDYRVAPCRAIVVRPMMMPRCRTVYMVPMTREYMVMCPYARPCYKRYYRGYHMKPAPKRIDMVPNLQNTAYGFRYHNIHMVRCPYMR
ncbi:hypothetical protein [Halodesulfovibrio sp.]|uniref:hypothetical protein n=1 Tax=Halodesulfovibrio sp. TaxID=1912772 RepID=UPI0025BBE41B|nr:hypothetical protein [Halodesulfovibrio sp.]